MTEAAAPRPRLGARRVAEVIVGLAVILFVARALGRQWSAARSSIHFGLASVGWLVAASVLLLLNYGVLVETWRRVLRHGGGHVPFADAVRVWTVSNLGKYVPGLVWQVSAMTVMLRRFGISMGIAGAAAFVVTLGNVAAGAFVSAALGAAPALQSLYGARAVILATATLGAALACYVALPALMPRFAQLLPRRLGERVARVRVTHGALAMAFLGCGAGWLMSGASFAIFAHAMLGRGIEHPLRWIAAYVGSYLIGYVAPFAPGGLGVREAALLLVLPALGLTTAGEAAALAVTSRLWLTVLEVGPGLALLPATRRAG